VLCLGNSYTVGIGAVPEMSYPAQLERMLRKDITHQDVVVINKGRCVQSTGELLSDLKSNIKQGFLYRV
jgi:hypothetical protein